MSLLFVGQQGNVLTSLSSFLEEVQSAKTIEDLFKVVVLCFRSFRMMRGVIQFTREPSLPAVQLLGVGHTNMSQDFSF